MLELRKPDRRSEADELRMEVRALAYERGWVATELTDLARHAEYAVHAERDDLALYVATRLRGLASQLRRREEAA